MNVEEHFGRAIRHAQAGEFNEAEAVCRAILAEHPHHAETLHVLGLLALEGGRNAEAAGYLGRAAELRDAVPHFHYNLGIAQWRLGNAAEAQAHYRRAIDLNPQYPQARTNLALVLASQGQFEEAYGYLMTALSMAEVPEARSVYVAIASAAPQIAAKHPDHLFHALTHVWGRPSELAAACIAAILANDAVAALIRESGGGWLSQPKAAESTLAAQPLLIELMESGLVCDPALEDLLTRLRAAMLHEAVTASAADSTGDAVMRFRCALARQCFINEYVYARPPQDDDQAVSLGNRISKAVQDGEEVREVWLAAAGAYLPLHTFGNAAALLARAWSEPVKALLKQQVEEPLDEAARGSSIRALASVHQTPQSADSAFPRWVKAAAIAPRTLTAHLRGLLPQASFRQPAVGSAIDILIAGCGSGEQVVEIARGFPGARITAADVSRANLAYAQRQASAFGLTQIEFVQGDIQNIGTLGRSFDLIDAGSALSSVRDPWAAWRALLSLLRRDGIMRVSLHSKLGRRDVAAARRLVSARQIPASLAGVRRARQEIASLPTDANERQVARFQDYYAMNSCRALLFDLQEHQTALPEIKAFLAANRLELIGLSIDADVMRRYGARFPSDKAALDLDNWHTFEGENPGTFQGMYQLYLQQAATPVN